MIKIKQRYLINTSIDLVWDALVNPQTIEKWGAGPAKMSPVVGFKFSLWGGEVWGENLEVEHLENGGKKLVQEWYGGEWETPSIVSFALHPDGKTTEVLLEHKDLPEDEVKDHEAGWREYYMGPIKKLLES